MEWIMQPWPWHISGFLIVVIMMALIFLGKSFGFSSNLRTLCSACGAGKTASFFDFNWRSQIWNLLFLVGSVIGGFISYQYLSTGEPVQISENTIQDLAELGIAAPEGLQPMEIYGMESAFTLSGFLILFIGGLLIGFGARYAGGCTSGHAISGLSNLQLPSLVAVIGFFIGGLAMTHLLFPLIF
jgi:uncharacterized protein